LEAGHSSRSEQPKGNENAIKTGGMTFRITSTQYGWKKIASITQLNPLKFMEITRKDPFTGDINTHNLNITGKK
jgi:hypothetical protein